jgi:AcrR family transcriptional regulator
VTGSHDARRRLIAAAEGLLTRSGPRSVSMDAAAAAAGAGKMSAYRHFASRDDLVAAALEHHHPRHLRWLLGRGADAGAGQSAAGGRPADPGPAEPASGDPAMPAAADLAGPAAGDPARPAAGDAAMPASGDPAGQILAAFDRLESAARSEPFRGCPFVDAALGAPGTGDRAGAIAWQHKQEVTRALAGLAAQAGLAEPEDIGAAVALVIDGAAVQAALAPDPASRQQIVRRGRRVAQALLSPAARS